MALRVFASMTVAALALVACSGGGGSTDGSGSSSSSFTTQFCEIYAQCCGKAGYPSDGVQCRNFYDQATAGREYNAAKADECLAGIRAESQRPDFCEDMKSPSACREVYKAAGGGVAPGQACKDDADCAASADGEVDCVSYSSSGSSSGGSSTTRICQVRTRAKEGEVCGGTRDGNTTSFTFSSSQSGPPPPKVGYCWTEDNLHCETTSTGTTRESKCVRIQPVGGPCTSFGSYACVKEAYCDTTKKLCTARVPVGGDCTSISSSSNVCVDKAYCDSASKKCVAALADGAPCESSQSCESRSCVNGKCEKTGGLEDLGYLLVCGPKPGG